MVEYRVIDGLSAKDIEDKVNAALKDGWLVRGGVSIATRPDAPGYAFAQAMVKYEMPSVEDMPDFMTRPLTFMPPMEAWNERTGD